MNTTTSLGKAHKLFNDLVYISLLLLNQVLTNSIISIDENGNQNETRKTNCDNQITDLATSFGKFTHTAYKSERFL